MKAHEVVDLLVSQGLVPGDVARRLSQAIDNAPRERSARSVIKYLMEKAGSDMGQGLVTPVEVSMTTTRWSEAEEIEVESCCI